MEVYVVNWTNDDSGDLDAVFSSLNEAKAFVEGEYKRLKLNNPSWDEVWAPDYVEFSYGKIWRYEVDTLPYILN